MPATHFHSALLYLRRLATPAVRVGACDAELLGQFVRRHDESAFAALVQRHGPGVLGVCRRILANEADAEDAFQAVFVVLARRAAAVARRESVGSFLYGVAVRIALRARADRTSRLCHERQATVPTSAEPTPEVVWNELRPILDEEVSRLPAKYREPLRLCYFDGRSYDEAARELRCSRGTIASRLSRAREQLRKRLSARGVAPGAALLATVLAAHAAPAAVPARLLTDVLRTVGVAGAPAGAIAPRVRQWAEAAMRPATSGKIKVVVVLLVATVVPAVAGITVFGRPGDAAPPQGVAEATPPAPVPTKGNPTWQLSARLGSLGWPQGSCQFAPDGRTLLTLGADRVVKLWDTESWKLRGSFDVGKRFGARSFGYMPFAPDSRIVSVWGSVPDPARPGKWVPELSVFETATGKELTRLPGKYGLHCPDGSALLTWRDDTLTLWDPHTFRKKFDLKAETPLHGEGVAFSNDGSLVCAPARGGKAYVWETATGKETVRLVGYFPVFAPDGKSVATCLPGGSVKLWDVATGRERAAWSPRGKADLRPVFSPEGRHLLMLANAAFTLQADGSTQINQGGPLSKFPIHPVDLRLCDAVSGAELARLPGMTRFDPPARFSPDGKTVAYNRLEPDENDREELVLWDVAAGKERVVPRSPEGLRTGGFSPDGTVLSTTGPNGGDLRLWDAVTGRRRPDLPGLTSSVSMRYSPDGNALAVTPGNYGTSGPTDLLVFRLSDKLLSPIVRGTPAAQAPPPVAKPSAEKPDESPAGRAMYDLQKASDAETQELHGRLQRARTDDERKPIQRQITDSNVALIERALRIVRENPTDPAALRAVEFGLRRTSGGYGGPTSKAREELLSFVRANFLRSPDLNPSLLSNLAHQNTAPADDLLAAVAESNPSPTVRGRAAYVLADELALESETVRLWRAMPALFDNPFMRERTEYLDRLRRADPDTLEREAVKWYGVVREKFADVVIYDGSASDKLGELAEHGLFALRHLTIGKVAPDIEGEDLDGKPFKLSGYRGKVVVLIFCGNWCGPCREMNPQKQRLVDSQAGKPFTLVEVNSDDDREAVKRTMRKEKLTWRCWFDGGRPGPIAKRWHIPGWPAIYVLDATGVIRYIDLRDKPLDDAVDRLVREAEKR
jgi:RNA polymerase sigma factor (sigma-70 family)